LGIEAIGSPAPELDAEVIGVLSALYSELGLGNNELRLNSMGCSQCRPGYSERLREFLAAQSSSLCGECRERAVVNPLRVYDCKVESCGQVLGDAPRLTESMCPDCATHHSRVVECLAMQGIEYVPDHTLVRGLDYYTRTTFEFVSPDLGAQSGMGGGGRYDDLVQTIGGPAVPGVGFGTGVERILLALERTDAGEAPVRRPTVYLVGLTEAARQKAFALAHQLRARRVDADLDYAGRSGKGQMTQADRSGARFAFIIGEQELADGSVTVRELDSGTERVLPDAEALGLAAEASAGQATDLS
jgi:histidyl-tRNA synthetase